MSKETKRKIVLSIKHTKFGSMGIGSLIVFIAMVLVAGIAASVLIQTSTELELAAVNSGRETRKEVSSDLDVTRIVGQYGVREINSVYYSRYHNMTIRVTPRSASVINLDEVIIQMSDGTDLLILHWNSSKYASSPSSNGVFSTSGLFDLEADSFGIIVVEDDDGSCISANPSINFGDLALLTVNLSACFNGLTGRADIEGMVITEYGSPGVFLFRTPAISSKTIARFL